MKNEEPCLECDGTGRDPDGGPCPECGGNGTQEGGTT